MKRASFATVAEKIISRVRDSREDARSTASNEGGGVGSRLRSLVPGLLHGRAGYLFRIIPVSRGLIVDMYYSVVLHVFTFLVVLQSIFKLELSVLACTEDFECRQRQNSSATSICCSGSCRQWWKCPGGCFSDDTCDGGKICFRNRCEDPDIDFPAYCSVDIDCSEQEQCESGQCKPAPRPVTPGNSDDVQVSFHFDPLILIIVGSAVGSLIFLGVAGYVSYRCFKRHRRRRLSRGAYTAPSRLSHGVNSFSPSGNEVEIYALYRQQHRPRPTLSGSSGFSYPQRPPPEYDSLTLDSNLEVESSSPPPYDNVGRTPSRTSDEAQV